MIVLVDDCLVDGCLLTLASGSKLIRTRRALSGRRAPGKMQPKAVDFLVILNRVI